MHVNFKLTALLAFALASPAVLANDLGAYQIELLRYRGRDCPYYQEIPEPSTKMKPAEGVVIPVNKCKNFDPNGYPFVSFQYDAALKAVEVGQCTVTAYTGAHCTGEEIKVDATDGAQGCQNMDVNTGGRSIKVTCNKKGGNLSWMHFFKPAALFALAFAAPALAKKADFNIKLYRYTDDRCGSSHVGHNVHLHNNKCKTFATHEPPFNFFHWESIHGALHAVDNKFPTKYYDDNCEVTAYSEPGCQGVDMVLDAIRDGDMCQDVEFEGRSVSVTCNGNAPDNA
ncbi:hypothetical protein LTR85_008465 [Meristemomyces frigidus]|nr:hypothetical protein LTR85_008465 [Meristemomyces frigidus]